MGKATEKANKINDILREVPNVWAEVRKNGRQVVLIQVRECPVPGLENEVEAREVWDLTSASSSELAMQLGEIIQQHKERL